MEKRQIELFSKQELESLQLEGIKISFEGVKVKKRDSREVLFDAERIFNAIEKAFRSTLYGCDDSAELTLKALKIGGLVLDGFRKRVKEGEKSFTVEEIQDAVENALYKTGETETYRHFREYREERARERQDAQSIDKTINRLISKEATTVNENANKDSGVFATRRDLTAGVTGKAIGLQMRFELASKG